MNISCYSKASILLLGLSCVTLSHTTVAQEASLYNTQVHTTASIPDLRNERDVKTKKRKFFNAPRPMVIAENQRIEHQRHSITQKKSRTFRTGSAATQSTYEILPSQTA